MTAQPPITEAYAMRDSDGDIWYFDTLAEAQEVLSEGLYEFGPLVRLTAEGYVDVVLFKAEGSQA